MIRGLLWVAGGKKMPWDQLEEARKDVCVLFFNIGVASI